MRLVWGESTYSDRVDQTRVLIDRGEQRDDILLRLYVLQVLRLALDVCEPR